MTSLFALTIPDARGTPIPINPPNTVQCGAHGCINTIVPPIINVLFGAAIVLALAYLLWGGLNWISSGGDKAKLQKARMKITYAIIGLIIVFFAITIINLVGNFLGITLLGLNL